MSETEYFIVEKVYPANNSLGYIADQGVISEDKYLSEGFKVYREQWHIHPPKDDLHVYGSCVNTEEAKAILLSTL